uniref:TIAM Rac1 associated GEF 2 n=1 Tax=Equus caballus TaxID=9796 RepID=A0A9L0RRY9_HORSE
MGNSESQYTLQGSKNHSHTITGAKQKPCSLKIRSIHAKDDKSLHGWGHGGSGAGYKSRSLARSCLSHFKSNQPYASRLGGPTCKVSKGSVCSKHRTNASGSDFQGSNVASSSENGFHYVGHEPADNHVAENQVPSRDCNGHLLNCYGRHESVASTPPGEDRKSPRVLIKTLGKLDGCLRVEFHNGDHHSPGPPGDSGGPVQLLRYSPTLTPGADSPPSTRLSATDSHPRSSKGSSLSSESSWYDSPWGHAGEVGEAEGPFLASGTPDPSLHGFPPRDAQKPFNQSSSLSSLRELYPAATLGSLSPSAVRLSDEYIGAHASLSHRVSFASDIDVPSRVEHRDPGQYASFTLPCRKSKALTEDTSKKDTLKARMRRISDWTGSLSRKKRKLQEPRSKEGSDYFDSRSDGLNADMPGPSWASATLWSGGSAQILSQRSESAHVIGSDPLRQNIYENFMQELEMSRTNTENVETSTETAESSSESLSSLEQLDLLFEKEQGVVRKAGWLFFKPLVTLQKERKLELVARRKWKQYWVTLKGCTLLFYETYGKNSTDQSSAPRCALFAEDSIVQSVPEHPKKENVFCLSNSFGDVYLFQATSQTDLENWVTAIHSACASLFAKKRGKEDTIRLLKNQTKNLIQKIDMDSKMKKMAELQLSVVSDPKNRKAIENQIQQWEQNLEKFHMDLFRTRCYLASLQGGELPNPKSLLAAASRPSKLALGRLGVLSVSSFHALVCSRDDSALRKRKLSLTQRGRNKKGIFSSLKGLDTLARKAKEKRPSITQIFDSSGSHGFSGTQLPQNSNNSSEVDELLHLYGSTVDGVPQDNTWEIQTYIHFQDNQGVTVVIKPEHRVEDILTLACKMRQLEPSHYGLQLRKLVDENIECCIPAPYEYMQEQVYDEIEVFPLNVYHVQLTKTGSVSDFGFAVTAQVDEHQRLSRIFISDVLPDGLAYGEGLRKGNEIMTLNGEAVCDLDLKRMEALFSEKSVGLTLIAWPPDTKGTLCSSWSDSDLSSRDQKSLLPPPNQSQLLEEFLDNFKKNTTNDFSNVPDITTGLKRSQTDGTLDQVSHKERMEQTFRSAEQIPVLCRSFNDTQTDSMEGPREGEEATPRPLARHLSDADRLRKVIQELVDTEKSYVKDLSCLFDLYLEPLQNETFLTQDEMESLFGSLPEMLEFQKVFLETLEDGISAASDFNLLETPSQFRKLLFSLGGSFLYYADHFKLYSGFCANHIKVQKVLERVFKRAVILVYKENCKLKKKLPSNSRPAHSSADLDPFKFRWLIPISALQVRLGNTAGTENNSVWELIHTKSEIEGRPETIFQLCCSDNESKTNIVKVIRSILRENFRRHIKCELPLEKTCKDRLVPLKNRVPVSAKLASSRSLKVLKNSSSSEWPSEPGKGSSLDSDEGSLSSSTQSSSCHTAGSRQDALQHPHTGLADFSDHLIKESDILSDEDEDYHQIVKQGSPTKDIEIQFQRLRISDGPDAQPPGQQPGTDGQPGGEQPRLVRGHFCAIKRKANSTKRDRGTLLKTQTRHQSLDSQSENASLDLNSVLEREFSVQSLTSVVNEECFYETESHGKS